MASSSQKKVDEFRKWFVSNGGYIHPDFALRHYEDDGGISMVYEPQSSEDKPAAPGSIIAACPHEFSLSSLNLSSTSPLFPTRAGSNQEAGQWTSLPDEIQDAGPRFLASLLLCAEFLLGRKSRWYHYIDTLPGPPATPGSSSWEDRCIGIIDTPMWYTESEMQWLEGTDVHRTALELDQQWTDMWEKHRMHVMKWSKENQLHGLDWNLFKWAMSIYGSRSFSPSVIRGVTRNVDGKQILEIHDPHSLLYPGVDLLNHSPVTKNRWDSINNGIDVQGAGQSNDAPSVTTASHSMPCTKINNLPNYFRLILNDDLTPGEQVFNTYGSQTNSQLLLSWGFCLEHNPDDRYAIKLLSNDLNPLLQKVIDIYETQESQSKLTQKLKHNKSTQPETIIPTDSTSNYLPILADDLKNNIYLVRTFAPTSGASNVDDDDYPSRKDPLCRHLSVFPELLLTKLSAQVTIAREQAQILSRPLIFPPGYLYRNAGTRNMLAVTDLLVKKLKLTLASPGMADVKVREMSGVNRHRLEQCNRYKRAQRAILEENIHQLNLYMETARDVNHACFPHFPMLSDLPKLLNYLCRFDAETAADFVAGFTNAEHGVAASAVVIPIEVITGVAEDVRQQGAEDIFVALAIAAFGIMNRKTGSAHLAQVIAYYSAPGSPGMLGVDEEQVNALVGDLRQYVANMRESCGSGRSGLWASGMWEDESFVRACVGICLEECLEVNFGHGPEVEGTLCLYTGSAKVGA